MRELSRRAEIGQRCFAIFGFWIAFLIVFAILVELISYAALPLLPQSRVDPLSPQKSPAYDNEKWGAAFWAEQVAFWDKARSNYLPFVIWSVRKWHGEFINTDDTEMGTWRRTIQATGKQCGPGNMRQVWVFGGSTVFGIGTPDAETIPSYLAHEYNGSPSSCVVITNFGSEGYVTNQELILLTQQLKSGRRPDVAIFYDGINDALVGGFSPGDATEHWSFENIRSRFESNDSGRLGWLKKSHFWRLIGLLTEKKRLTQSASTSDSELAGKARATIGNYESNLKMVRLLADDYGFRTYFFWQPVLPYGDKPLTPFEQKLRDTRAQEYQGQVHRSIEAVYHLAELDSASKNFVFLGRAFDTTNELVYVDDFHLGPRGNEIIAKVIAREVGAVGGAIPRSLSGDKSVTP